ncbi:MAG: 3-phosphoshikimate 1-carboxyvinyltransferase [Pseudomonadales bacterium]|nr:3-phosphoshikimate 1-carboxyvinyltransferase [Pseudomonadales bacterium]
MEQLIIEPVTHAEGEIQLPGSKSLTNRALLLAALATGETRLHNLLNSADTERMLEALNQLAVPLETNHQAAECLVTGQGRPFTPPNEMSFFLGNAGTAIRPLTSILSLCQGTFLIDGDEYMRERPIEHLIEALNQLGVKTEYLGKHGCPPVRLHGGTLKGGKVSVKGNISSQYLTALLMTLPLAREDSEITVIGEQVSKPYLDITLDIMEKFGVHASHDNYQLFKVPGGQQYTSPGDYLIEGDASSASYFFAAAAIKGGTIRVNGLGRDSVQGDIGFLDVMEAMGATVTRTDNWIEVTGGELRPVDMDLNHIPDAAMTVAMVALFAKGKSRISNIYNWRVKETDRMTAMATELRKLGAIITTGEDFIEIEPPEELQPATIDTYGDHRMAMCFSLAALGSSPVTINDPGCVDKTFPTYFTLFNQVTQR